MFPFVRYSSKLEVNGTNIPGLVTLKKGLQYPAAVLAQEAWESTHKMDPIKLLYRVFLRDDDDQREFEYMGHECEVQAARIIYGLAPAPYRLREAKSLQRGYSGLFSNLPVALIEEEMRERQDKATDWVRDNLRHLRRHKDGKP